MSISRCSDTATDEIIDKNCECDEGALQSPAEVCDEPVQVGYVQRELLDIQAAVMIPRAWNVPKCSETVILPVPKFKLVPIGGYLWSSVYGLFQLIRHYKDEISLVNTCAAGNAAIGTTVPANSTFIVTASPVTPINEESAFLAADFIAPLRGSCTTARFTSLNGVAPGMQIQLDDGNYYIVESLGGGVVRICENGGGVIPGTLVSYKNVFGQNQVPVIAISSSFVQQNKIVKSTILSSATPEDYIVIPLLVRNPFVNKSLALSYKLLGRLNGVSNTTDNTNPLQFILTLITQFDDNVATEVISLKNSVHAVPGIPRGFSSQISWSSVATIPAFTQTVLYAAIQLSWDSIDTASNLTLEEFSITATAMGVLV